MTARRTAWRPPDPRPLHRQRGTGEILRASSRLYRENLTAFIGIGLIYIPIAIVAGAVQWALFHLTSIEVLLLLTSRSLTFIDITGSIVYAVTVPYAAIALTLYYYDPKARRHTTLSPPRTIST